MNYPLFIVLLALSTYVPRALPAVVIDKIRFSQRWKVFLKLLPYTVMAALIFPSSLSADSQSQGASIIGVICAIIAGSFSLPPIVVVLLSVFATWISKIFLGI